VVKSEPIVIVALDFDRADPCLALAERLDPKRCRLKVGKELFTSCGPAIVEQLQARGFDIFLDLKFHDIPNTVARALSAAARLGVWMVNVHASGGARMLDASVEALTRFPQPPLLIAVTVLTSMDEAELRAVGVERSLQEQVSSLAQLSRQSGLDGVVCSAHECSAIKSLCGRDFLTVTPGIRPANTDTQDQRRITTPAQALALGSDYLVIGRPITGASDPSEALESILRELKEDMGGE